MDGDAEQERAESLLDHVDVLRVLRASDDEERGRILEAIGTKGPIERELVEQLSATSPLDRPAEFEQTHRRVMRSLEVLDRTGSRPVTAPARLGPLRPIAAVLVQLVTRWIVTSHVNSLARNVRRLYERREASTAWGSPEHHLLRRARIHASRVEDGMRSNPIGLPTFILGGAVFTGSISAAVSGLRVALEEPVLVLIIAIVAVMLLASLSWVAIYAAAVARYRIRLSTDQSMKELYSAIGAAGEPPRDQSFNLAFLAIVLMVVAVVVVPIGIWLVVRSAR